MPENIGPEATQELLNPAGAAGAAQPVSEPAKPPEGYVPLAAIQGEQANTKAARDALQRTRESLEGQGYQLLDDGSVIPPQEKPAVGATNPKVHALAMQLGIDPGDLQAAIAETVTPMADAYVNPISAGTAELFKRSLASADPDYAVYEKSIDRHLATLPVHLRSHPKAVEQAVRMAKADHLDALTTRLIERKSVGPGKPVGRFTEGTASGQPGSTSQPYNAETLEWARQSGFTPADIAAAAKMKADREGG